jgi:putative restriction endonuclease
MSAAAAAQKKIAQRIVLHDAAFDSGLISFANDGSMLISSTASVEQLLRIGVDPSAPLRQTDPAHFPYLEYHRAYIFGKRRDVSD